MPPRRLWFRLLTLVLLAIPSLVWPLDPAPAADHTSAFCTVETVFELSPGLLWTTPSKGQFQAGPDPIDCRGTVNGKQLSSAPGTVELSGSYTEGTCTEASGDGIVRAVLRTTDGAVRVAGTFQWQAVGAAATARGAVEDSSFQAAGNFRPDPEHFEEDCFNRRLQHVIFRGQAALGEPQLP